MNKLHTGDIGKCHFPNGTMIPCSGSNSPFHRIGGHHQVRLARVNTALPVPLGQVRM